MGNKTNIRDLHTQKNLIDWIEKNVPVDKRGDEPLDIAAIWFIATTEAKTIFDSYSTKDLAGVLLSGVRGIAEDPEEYARVFFATFWEDLEHLREEGDDEAAMEEEENQVAILSSLLCDHFAIK